MRPALGVDFGGVIVRPSEGEGGHPSARDPGAADEIDGAIVALSEAACLFDDRLWIVSKTSPPTEEWSRRWLFQHDFVERTGVPLERVRFVREREGKLDVCKELRITHFIDDFIGNLEILRSAVPYLYLFGCGDTEDGVEGVRDWPEALVAMRNSVAAIRGAPPN